MTSAWSNRQTHTHNLTRKNSCFKRNMVAPPNSGHLPVIHDTMRIINQFTYCYQRHLDAGGGGSINLSNFL